MASKGDDILYEGRVDPASSKIQESIPTLEDHQEKLVRFEADVLQSIEASIDNNASEKLLNGPENRPKKSLFEITSVVNTENESRGEGLGNEVEDSEFDDTLSETQEFNITSPTTTPTRHPRHSSVSSANGNETTSGSQTNTNATSRFKIVKIPRTARSEPHKRGRWTCQEFFDPPQESKIERTASESRLPPVAATSATTNHANSRIVVSAQPALVTTDTSVAGGEERNNYRDGRGQRFVPLERGQRPLANQQPAQQPRKQSPSEQPLPLRTTDVEAPNLHTNNDNLTFQDQPRAQQESEPDLRMPPQSFEEALTQLSALQSNLVTVVATLKEVEQLKETMLTWTDENRQLKEENERLKRLLQKEDDRQDPPF
eukprot:gene10871-12027_t